MSDGVRIAGRIVGPDQPVFVVAEAGVNHNGDIALAKRLVQVAAEAGADAVKFQSFAADRLASPRTPKAGYQLLTTGIEGSQRDMLRQLELSVDAHHELRAECEKHGVVFLSTPFDEVSADLLEALDVAAFKLGSGEVTNRLLLEHVGRKGRPVLLSTGMSYLDEVSEALRALTGAGCRDVVLLHCVSSYPAEPRDANLRAMTTMAGSFDRPVGFSDHTLGLETAIAAVALGACLIEKHFTLDRSLPGPDHRASLEPGELRELVAAIRSVESALGDGVKRPMPVETENRQVSRRSLAAAVDLRPGTVLTPASIRALRPATGIPANALEAVIGRRVRHAVPEGELLTWEMLE